MRYQRVALIGLVGALAAGTAACSSSSKSSAKDSTTTSTTSGSGSVASVPVAKRGVVTVQMATVGDPGNPSVGVVQAFKKMAESEER